MMIRVSVDSFHSGDILEKTDSFAQPFYVLVKASPQRLA